MPSSPPSASGGSNKRQPANSAVDETRHERQHAGRRERHRSRSPEPRGGRHDVASPGRPRSSRHISRSPHSRSRQRPERSPEVPRSHADKHNQRRGSQHAGWGNLAAEPPSSSRRGGGSVDMAPRNGGSGAVDAARGKECPCSPLQRDELRSDRRPSGADNSGKRHRQEGSPQSGVIRGQHGDSHRRSSNGEGSRGRTSDDHHNRDRDANRYGDRSGSHHDLSHDRHSGRLEPVVKQEPGLPGPPPGPPLGTGQDLHHMVPPPLPARGRGPHHKGVRSEHADVELHGAAAWNMGEAGGPGGGRGNSAGRGNWHDGSSRGRSGGGNDGGGRGHGRRNDNDGGGAGNESQRYGRPGDGAPPVPGPPPQQPNMGLSGKLAAEANKVDGVELKHVPPLEARKPDKNWRLYVFKGSDMQEKPYHLHKLDHYLFGRDLKITDVLCAHPSISKQHAVIQFRLTDKPDDIGLNKQAIRPYLIDLGTTNGTFLNDERLEALRYYELLPKDVIRFGSSSREYVLLHEQSAAEEEAD